MEEAIVLQDEVQEEVAVEDEEGDEALRDNIRSLPPPLDRSESLPLILIPFDDPVRMP